MGTSTNTFTLIDPEEEGQTDLDLCRANLVNAQKFLNSVAEAAETAAVMDSGDALRLAELHIQLGTAWMMFDAH